MLVWPANSWLFWIAAAVGVGLYFGAMLCLRREQGVSRKRATTVGVLLAGAIVLIALAPSALFAVLSTSGLSVPPGDAAWWSVSALVGIAAIGLGAWALFADRSGGRKRCPKCWYDMAGTPTLMCPECGRAARHEWQLFKTRRRKWWAAFAVLLVLGAASGASWPTARDTDWEQATPDWVLLLAMPYLDGDEWLAERLFERVSWPFGQGRRLSQEIRDGQAAGWKRTLAAWRCRTTLEARRSTFAINLGIELSAALSDNEVDDFGHLVVDLCGHADEEVRWRSLAWLADRSRFGDKARSEATRALSDPDRRVRIAASIALQFIAKRDVVLQTAPPALIEAARSGSEEEWSSALLALANYAPTPEIVELVEARLQAGDSYRVFEILVKVSPKSELAHATALKRLRSGDAGQVIFAAGVMAKNSWSDVELLDELVRAVRKFDEPNDVREVLKRIAGHPWLAANERVDILLRIAEREALRQLVAQGFASLGPDGKPVLPRLRAQARAWEKVDPSACVLLRNSISEIESLPE